MFLHTLGSQSCSLEINVGQYVAIDDQKRLVTQKRQGGGNAAGGFQASGALWRIGNTHAVVRTIFQSIFDLLAKPGMVDDDFSESGLLQAAQVPADKRRACYFE